MTAGFQVYSPNNGVLQVDGEYINCSLRKSGYITDAMVNKDYIDGYQYFLDITDFNRPLIAVKNQGANNKVCVEVIRPSSETSSFGYVAGRTYVRFAFPSAAGNAEYYIFDQWSAPKGNKGIEVYSSSGDLVFHSDWYTLRIVGMLSVPALIPSKNGSASTIGNVVQGAALLQTYSKFYSTNPNLAAPSLYRAGVWVDGTTAKIQFMYAGVYGGQTAYNRVHPMTILQVDTSACPIPYN